MDRFRKNPNRVPESLYIVREPSNDHCPLDIGFLPFDILKIGRRTAFSFLPDHYGAGDGSRKRLPSIYVAVTDDLEAARNDVITSEKDLMLYKLNGRCDEMKRRAIFKATDLAHALGTWEGDESEGKNDREERQKKLQSEWLIWPSVPKESVLNVATKEAILEETEREQQALEHSRASTQQKSTASLSRDSKHKQVNKGKAKVSSDSTDNEKMGIACKEVDSNSDQAFIAILPGMKARAENFPFSTIYTIEERKAGQECLIHWGAGVEPSWVSITRVDSRAIEEFQQRKTKADRKRQPRKGDPYEIIYEEQKSEDTKLDSRFLVRWINTGKVTWEVYGGEPGVTRVAGGNFLAKRGTWKRYCYT